MVHIETDDQLRTIVRNLEYNHKRRGRILTTNLPRLGLCRGWRLEATSSLPDVGKLEAAEPPLDILFWTADTDARLVHTNPLFRLEGVSLSTWSIDVMHAWHLGPMQQHISLTVHACIDSGVFAPRTVHMDAAGVREVSLLAIKAELFQFYKELRSSDPEWKNKGSEAA